MKRVFAALLLAVTAISTSAQFVSDRSVWREEPADNDFNHSGVFVNPQLGIAVGNGYGFGFGLGVGYRLRFADCFAWDVFSVGADFATHHNGYAPHIYRNIFETASIRFLTGCRYNARARRRHPGFYAGIGVGMAVLTRSNSQGKCKFGPAVEGGLGVNITRCLSAGIYGQGNIIDINENGDGHESPTKTNVGIRLGVNF